MEALHEIDAFYPNATFILNLRPIHNWLRSVNNWNDMRERIVRCNISSLPQGVGLFDDELVRWYEEHVVMIKTFVQEHASHRLVTVDIESDNAGKVLHAFGHGFCIRIILVPHLSDLAVAILLKNGLSFRFRGP